MKSFPKSASNLVDYYPTYKQLIEDGVWYADHLPLDDRAFSPEAAIDHRWTVQAYRPDRPGDYWVPESERLRAQMKQVVHAKQYTGGFPTAVSLKGTPRTATDFLKFPVGYEFTCRYEGLAKPDMEVARTLGDALVDDTVRLTEFDLAHRKMVIEKATYLDQVATNISCDARFQEPILSANTFRELDRQNATDLLPLERCHQANTIGVACILFGSDGVPLLALRSNMVAVMNDKMGLRHCSASGVLTWQDMLEDPNDDDSTLTIAGLKRGMEREILEELRLMPTEYTLQLTEYARELPRAGKPQFFFVARHPASAGVLLEMIVKRMPGAIGSWERDTTEPGRIAQLFGDGRKGGLVIEPTLRIDSNTLGALSKMKNQFTYEGYAAFWFEAHRRKRVQ